MKYVSQRLGKNLTNSQLAELINDPNQGTSLYKLQQFAQGLGLYCTTVKTDIETLKSLSNCQIILHFPRNDHYVVLEYIDDGYVWVVDLDTNKFFYRTKFSIFNQDWNNGTAQIISKDPLNNMQGNLTVLNDSQTRSIIGGFPNYSCTKTIQNYGIIRCPPIFGIYCLGRYTKFFTRMGCEEDPDGGTCAGEDLPGVTWFMCIVDPNTLDNCILSSDFYTQSMRACE